jgi:hypothetical protein
MDMTNLANATMTCLNPSFRKKKEYAIVAARIITISRIEKRLEVRNVVRLGPDGSYHRDSSL